MERRLVGTSIIVGSTLLLGSCAGMQGAQQDVAADAENSPVVASAAFDAEAPRGEEGSLTAETSSGAREYVKRGSGRFIRGKPVSRPAVAFVDGDITLNFEKTDIQEVVKVIVGDLLKENYAVGPGVAGMVSLQTSRPIGREMLLPMLENLLRMNGAVLVREEGMYRVNALADAARGTLTPSIGAPKSVGYHVAVVPLRYISATEMHKVLQPVIPEGGPLLVDDKRNLLMLGGSSQELTSWMSLVDIFDVDWMRGYSVGLFPLENTSAKVVAKELDKVLLNRAEGNLGKMVRLEPIERLNALLVITPQVRYLDQVKGWIARLDTVGSEPGRRLYVYQVKNRKATELADVINEIFSGQPSQSRSQLNVISAYVADKPAEGGKDDAVARDKPVSVSPVATLLEKDGLALAEGANIRIVADPQNNAILVMASGAEYRIVEAAIRKLDVVPLQVLVEASIMEITLSDELSYGLEWYFKNHTINTIDSDFSDTAMLDLNAGEGIGSIIPGFSYAVVNAANDVNAVLNMLATESKLNVLSSPSLMVLDNSKANIRVGEQVPVRTSGERALGEQTIYETFEYKDTGVMLSVTPRVNSGGLVTMEIDQAITDIGAIESTTLQRKFLQRNIKSEVAIQSGQTVILGGLILENDTDDSRGVPGLRDIPILGWLFGATKTVSKRTELLVLITPRVVRNQQDASAITQEFKHRMDGLKPPKQEAEEPQSVPATDAVKTGG
ncbi:MAG: type II secretion system secretin GspD [Pseudomonadota bacterium]